MNWKKEAEEKPKTYIFKNVPRAKEKEEKYIFEKLFNEMAGEG